MLETYRAAITNMKTLQEVRSCLSFEIRRCGDRLRFIVVAADIACTGITRREGESCQRADTVVASELIGY